MINIEISETRFYISTQDGRLDDIEFDTAKEAEAELATMSEKRGLYVTSYTRKYPKTINITWPE